MRKILVGSVLVTSLALFTGCEEETIMYEGKMQKVTTVEEIIADKLEVENPDEDLDINITEDSE